MTSEPEAGLLRPDAPVPRGRVGGESVQPVPSAEGLLDSLEDVVWSAVPEGHRLLFMSRSARRVFGHPPEAFLNDADLWPRMLHPADRERFVAASASASRDLEYRVIRADGSVIWLRDRSHPVLDETGVVTRIDGLLSEITAVKQREADILRMLHLHGLLQGISSAIRPIHDRGALFETLCRFLVEPGGFAMAWIGIAPGDGGRLVTAARLLAHEASPPPDLPPIGAACPPEHLFARSTLQGRPVVCQALASDPALIGFSLAPWRWQSLLVLPLRAENRAIGCLVLASTDACAFPVDAVALLQRLAFDTAVAITHIENEEWLSYQVMYDNLTGLANRTLFLDRLTQLIHRRNPFALIVFDIDRFKYINESLTHQAGDMLLQSLASRLAQLIPESDLARPGGDDFALVLPETHAELEIARFVREKLLPAVSRPFAYRNEELRISLKLGVACYPADGAGAAALLENAEKAHREAQNSNEPMLFFGDAMNRGMGDFLRMESRLRRAAEQGEFIVHYQPKIDLRQGRMSGVEALIRWNDPEQGIVLPGEFIRVLEETGVILEVGRWILREAARQFLQWAAKVPSPPRIAVNISSQQLGQRDFIADVEAAVATCRPFPPYLELEITESSIMHDVEGNIRKLHTIREMGVEISMDDFGTGYSSLSYLTRLPLTRLKIDRSFIVGMTEDADNLAIVSSIISLAHTLDLKVAAEGVETREQLKFLRLLRCDEIQGYLFGPPVEAEAALGYGHLLW